MSTVLTLLMVALVTAGMGCRADTQDAMGIDASNCEDDPRGPYRATLVCRLLRGSAAGKIPTGLNETQANELVDILDDLNTLDLQATLGVVSQRALADRVNEHNVRCVELTARQCADLFFNPW